MNSLSLKPQHLTMLLQFLPQCQLVLPSSLLGLLEVLISPLDVLLESFLRSQFYPRSSLVLWNFALHQWMVLAERLFIQSCKGEVLVTGSL